MKSRITIAVKALLLFVLVNTLAVNLQATERVDKQPTLIRYIGKDGNMLVFEVALTYENGQSFQIRDENGNVLFNERITANLPARRFKIAAEGIKKLHFETSKKEVVERKTFTIDYRIEERLSVTESN
jgi:hypothetical protein